MCGIFGALSKSTAGNSGAVLPRDVVERALAALHHRGPDGTGYRFSQKSEYSVVLGQARLAIIGLDDAAGAMVNEDGSVFAVVNGEFYDFERIRQELQAEGHRFSTECDSEILVHLYEKYGLDCLSHLRGEFAFVLYDQNQNRLFAARDRFGIKPFVYAESADKLLFASEAKALFAAAFMRDRIGDRMEGTVSGLSGGGVYVTLDEPPVDGMVRKARLTQHHRVNREELSVREHMISIMRRLQGGEFVAFDTLFDSALGVPALVVGFLAVLELVKERLVACTQNEPFAPIYVKLTDADPEFA